MPDLSDLAQLIEECEVHAHEIETQHRAECAAYGDSWPGAAIQVADAWERVRAAKKEYEAASMTQPGETFDHGSIDEDIPF